MSNKVTSTKSQAAYLSNILYTRDGESIITGRLNCALSLAARKSINFILLKFYFYLTMRK